MNFASDNAAGIAPEILAAISRANDGAALAYGRDDWTKRVERRFAEIFQREVAVFLVPTGTAANALALAHLTPPWGAVLCHDEAHIATDECGAPEFFGGGIKLIGLAGEAGKIAPATLQRALDEGQWGGPHHVSPAVLSLSQATEAGTVYRVDEIRQLADIAHAHGVAVHIDGARIANALARMNASPAQATWMAGVDVLSFGATKGGALAAEAVVFFDAARGANMAERRKRGGHLVSKHRFIAAQIEAYLAGDLWLKLARHANAMADRLAAGLAAAGLHPVWPVEANEVFAALPLTVDTRLKAAGASYYPWTTDALPDGVDAGARYHPRASRHFVRHDCGRGRSICGGRRVLLDDTAAPKLRPIPCYRCDHAPPSRDRLRLSRIAFALSRRPRQRTGDNPDRGNFILQHKIALCAGLVAALAVAGHALAQPAPPPVYPGTVYPGAGLPPHEIVTIVRSTGLEPMGSPVRQGPTYALRAVDPAGEEVRVIVDAQRGRIVKVIPLMAPRYAMPLLRPPYGRPPRPMAMVPEGYGPNPRAPTLPPGAEGPSPPNAAGPGGYRAGLLALGRGASPDPAVQAGPPPLPRPRPKLASTRFIRCQAGCGGARRRSPIKAGRRARNHRQRHHAGQSGRRGAGRGVRVGPAARF